MTAQMTKPLEGILVVSFDQVVAAPLAARRLADAGARVIKLERKEGTRPAGMTASHRAPARISPGSTAARNRSSST
jgi:crotonobetainyl-CoA:carnitine CoA-transferase CaiB-like acyl-CoA transferase